MQVRVIQKQNIPKLVDTLLIKYRINRIKSHPIAVKNTTHVEHIYPRFEGEASKRGEKTFGTASSWADRRSPGSLVNHEHRGGPDRHGHLSSGMAHRRGRPGPHQQEWVESGQRGRR